MSDRVPAGVPWKSSGAMNVGVPARGAALRQILEAADQTEIRQLGVVLRREQHIRRLDVAMDQARIVGRAQGQDDLSRQDRRAAGSSGPSWTRVSRSVRPPGTYSISMK